MTAVMLVNLTPHEITLHGGSTEIHIPSLGGYANGICVPHIAKETARIRYETAPLGYVGEVPIVTQSIGEVYGLPAQVDRPTIYIVPIVVATHQNVMHRSDIVSPGEPIRDSQGRIIGCRGLVASLGLAYAVQYQHVSLGLSEVDEEFFG